MLANVRNVKITSPDYKGVDPDKAVQDYMTRIRDHERYYEPVDEPDWPWIKIINVRFSFFNGSPAIAELFYDGGRLARRLWSMSVLYQRPEMLIPHGFLENPRIFAGK